MWLGEGAPMHQSSQKNPWVGDMWMSERTAIRAIYAAIGKVYAFKLEIYRPMAYRCQKTTI